MKRKIAILGSTGSIGTQALDILSNYPEHFEIKALATNQNIDLLSEQVKRFSPLRVAVVDEQKACEFKKSKLQNVRVESGKDALVQLAVMDEVDTVLVAVVGISGLEATIAALKAGKDVALANKETLVAGGNIVMKAARESNAQLIPVDSEHSAIYQCLNGKVQSGRINKIYLTASGGPFRGYKREKLKRVTVAQALKHPNWEMGKKITVDSATLMNKGLEVIEARWLFDLSVDQIEVIIHPQSIIHSMVEFVDGSILAQMSKPDMRLPILYAMTYPDRIPSMMGRLSLAEVGTLTFEEPDIENFPCLSLGYKAIKIGGTMPAVLNAANEVAVEMFLQGKISFLEIPIVIEKAMKSHQVIEDPDINDILRVDQDTRRLLLQKDGVV